MSTYDFARSDWKLLSQDVEIELTSPDDDNAIVKGLSSNHNFSIDPGTGLPASLENAHASVFEELLTEVGYPTRDVNGNVNMEGHLVSFTDNLGTIRNYKVQTAWPDKTVGVIVMILVNYEES